MHAKAAALLDAHVRHSLNQLTGPALASLVQSEIQTFFTQMGDRPVSQWVDEVTVRDFLLRNVFARELTPGLRGQLRHLLTQGLASPLHEGAQLETLLNVREVELIIDRALDLEELRREIVHAVLDSPVYSDVLSDLLYHSIKEYLLEENVLTKKVPGMSSLMKIGKGVVGRMGGLEETLEKTIKHYIKQNIRATVELSEQLIEKAFQGPKIREICRDAWGKIKTTQISDATRYIDIKDVEDAEDIANTIWNHVRQTEYAKQLLTEMVHIWFDANGDRPLTLLVQDLGYDADRLCAETLTTITPIAAILLESGYIEQRLRAHLESFYASAAVAEILA